MPGFYNRDGEGLLRGTDWIFKCNSGWFFSFKSWCANVRETGLVLSAAYDHVHAAGCGSRTSASVRTARVVTFSGVNPL